MSDYIGREPYTSNFFTDTFTGTGSTTYTLSYSPGSSNSILVFIDGVYQMPGISNAYTVSNKILTFTENVSTLSTIFVVYLGLAASIGTPGAGTVDFAQLSGNILPPGIMWDYGGVVAPTGWLLCDGSIYSRSTFSGLFGIIGTTFGNGTGSGLDFSVPDFRSRMAIGAGTGSFISTFLPAAVNTGTGQITVAANLTLFTGDLVTYTTTGTTISGLTPSTQYYIIRISSTVVQLASSLANAQNSVNIALSSTGTGVHTLTLPYTARTLGSVGGEEAHAMNINELLSHSHIEVGQGIGAPSNQIAMQAATNLSNSPQNFNSTQPTGGNATMNVMNPFLVVTKIIKT